MEIIMLVYSLELCVWDRD